MSPHNLTLSRRALLRFFGLSLAGGFLGYTRLSKPEPAIAQTDRLDLPYFGSDNKHVAVIGGGLAGLACTYELSKRGFRVTLLEKSPQLGGKVASWPIRVGDKEFIMEHGFHGFFPQYYNLKSLVSELELEGNFRALDSYAVAFRGNRYGPEVFRPSHSAFPWNVVDLAFSSPNRLRWGINLASPKHWQVFREIGGFSIPESFDRLDALSVADWVGNDFPRGLYDLYFLPFAKSSLNAPDSLSAGELMQFFHFYFFGNPEGLAFNGTRFDMGSSLVDPIARAISARGGQIITEATVTEIRWRAGEVKALSYLQGRDARHSSPFWVAENPRLQAEFERSDATRFYGAGDNVFAKSADASEAISLTCTHQGCTVKPQADGSFICPCHGARYDREGRVLSGPAQRDLARLHVKNQSEAAVELVAATSTDAIAQTLEADYFVIATDVPGAHQILNLAVGEVDVELRDRIGRLAVADPFAVARFWFDRDFSWDLSDFTSLSGYRLADSITLYHRIQEQFIAWHAETGGSVVELHAYCYKEDEFPTQETLLETFESELYEIVPDLAEATLLHRELVNQKNFSGYPPGSYRARPETVTSTSNLLLAGDWVKMPFPSGLMERAVSSGLLAANAVLQKEGRQRRTLYSVKPQGAFNFSSQPSET